MGEKCGQFGIVCQKNFMKDDKDTRLGFKHGERGLYALRDRHEPSSSRVSFS